MNGAWDHDVRGEQSAWVDTYARPTPYPDPVDANNQPDPTQNPWRYASHVYRITQTDPVVTPGTTPYAYDEIHEPATHPWQTRDKWRALCARTTEPSYVAVAWTLTDGMKDLVLGVKDGYADNPASKLVICPELFVFGDDPQGTGDAAMAQVDWFDAQGLTGRMAPIYVVSNAAHKAERYARAFSEHPGQVAAQWLRIMTAMRDRGRYDAWLWGAGYRRIGEVPGTPGMAVRAWDQVVASVYYGG